MTQVDDLSRSLIAFEQNNTVVVVLEMSQSSWLAAGVVPGIERRPLKKLHPDPTVLLRLVEGWRDHAMKAGRMITRIEATTSCAPSFDSLGVLFVAAKRFSTTPT
jgi:transposase